MTLSVIQRWVYASKAVCTALALGLSVTSAAQSEQPDSMNLIVHDFLVAGLVHFHHDKSTHLFIGDNALKAEADTRTDSLAEVVGEMTTLRERIAALPETQDAQTQQRRRDLTDRVAAFETRGAILLGDMPASFDEETQRLFGVTAPHYSEAHFAALTEELAELFPGDAPLSERIEQFRERFVIPVDKLESVIGTAMAECRRRTKLHFELPEDEKVTLHIARNQPFVGFTYYRGNSHSEIHLNADVPVHIERAIELGCHEGYPGHHVHATLLERDIIKSRGWEEYSLITLFGPMAVVAEGAASHAIDLVFSERERMAFERDVLLPLAGLSGDDLEKYYRYVSLIEALNFARNEAARLYLYNGMSREDAIQWLMDFGLETRATASQRLDFIEAWRSYVVTYNTGRVLVRNYIASHEIDNNAGGKPALSSNQKWDIFKAILLTPLLPQDLERIVSE